MIKIAICDDCAEDREVLITQINEIGKKINNTLDNDFQIKGPSSMPLHPDKLPAVHTRQGGRLADIP